jgi:subtilase family serine protease
MKHNRGNFRATLLGIALALAVLRGGGANSAGEEMTTLHSTLARGGGWSEPADKRLTLWMAIVVKVNKEELDKFTADVQDPKSPNYLHGLPRGKAGSDEFKRRFWPPPSEIMALTDWLSSEGFEIQEPVNSGLRAIGTVAMVEKAFATTIVRSPDGYYYANQTQPQIPARFADVVGAMQGLDNMWGEVHGPIGSLMSLSLRIFVGSVPSWSATGRGCFFPMSF